MKSVLKWTVLCAALFSQALINPNLQAAAGGKESKESSAQGQQTFRAGKLIGTTAKDAQGHSLGDVKDFTLNPQTGEMFALIDIGGGRLATVPWQLVKVGSDAKGNVTVTVNTPKSVLQGAPSVTKDQWNSLQDPTYTQRVYSYFQIQPSGMGAAGSQSEKQQGKGQSTGAQPQEQKQTQQAPEQQKSDKDNNPPQGQETNQQNQAQP